MTITNIFAYPDELLIIAGNVNVVEVITLTPKQAYSNMQLIIL